VAVVVGALTGADCVAATTVAVTGSVAPATGRSATAVDVAKLRAERSAARRVTSERTRRDPCGPICRSGSRERS
jgi:hypothetical protein